MLFDTHAHLDQEDFDADRADVVERAAQAGVEPIVAVGTTAPTSRQCVELAQQFPRSCAAVGIQPNYTAAGRRRAIGTASSTWPPARAWWPSAKRGSIAIGTMRRWRCSRIISIGICGCRKQRDLPFIVHTRESDADVLAMLREARSRGPLWGVMHSFTGTAETAAECVELGLCISFAGMVTFKKSRRPAGRGRHGAGRPHPDRNRQPLSFAASAARQTQRAGQCGSYGAAVVAAARGKRSKSSRQTTANARPLFGLPS